MNKSEVFGTMITLIVGIILFILIPYQSVPTLLTRPSSKFKVTAQTFPKVAIVLIILFSILELARLFLRYHQDKYGNFRSRNTIQKNTEDNLKLPEDPKKIAYTIAGLLFMAMFVNMFGFVLAGTIMCVGLSYYYKAGLWKSLLVGIITPILLYYIFVHVFNIPLPNGVFEHNFLISLIP